MKRVISMKHVSTLSGVYSVIARLEPMGEARSTAELYLSGKGLYHYNTAEDTRVKPSEQLK